MRPDVTRKAARSTQGVGMRPRPEVAALAAVLALQPALAQAQTALVRKAADIPTVTVAPGVLLKELTGLGATGDARTGRASVAWVHLEPGRASAWSYNKVGEESFFVLSGRGTVWTDGKAQPVARGSFILIPARTVRSVRAAPHEALDFYAVTTPAWTVADDVLTSAPAGAPP